MVFKYSGISCDWVHTTLDQSLRSRASSATSNGLDSNQIHFLFNKRGSRSSITTSSSHETSSPTSTTSSHSVQIDPAARKTNVIMVAPHAGRGSLQIERKDSSERQGGSDETDDGQLCSPRPFGRQHTAPSLPLATKLLYVGEVVWQIDDTVYVGSQDAVANMNLLCRLNIEFVCDLCNEDGEEANSFRRRYDCPCLCPRRSQHFRYFVAMDVPETEKKCIDSKVNMTVLFDQFCDLVERGRKAGKSVLVCSAKGRNRAPAFCAAYLISKEKMSRQQAVAKVLEQMNTMRPAPNISDFMQRSLMRYQSAKGIQGVHDTSHTIPLFSIKRTAWT
ncbi:hypothetical protein Y032_0576g221 [Ancylostoma ceylanicum]|uniref:protein-tyrosine-phosphatase n=1 Tax=Ancylostoma ceylanicum TaxID=53326 RepID=A0A016WQE5_9BILA|nr:hypothetical protein Y032_0576g221 [Ancylostoma ceylanicum]